MTCDTELSQPMKHQLDLRLRKRSIMTYLPTASIRDGQHRADQAGERRLER